MIRDFNTAQIFGSPLPPESKELLKALDADGNGQIDSDFAVRRGLESYLSGAAIKEAAKGNVKDLGVLQAASTAQPSGKYFSLMQGPMRDGNISAEEMQKIGQNTSLNELRQISKALTGTGVGNAHMSNWLRSKSIENMTGNEMSVIPTDKPPVSYIHSKIGDPKFEETLLGSLKNAYREYPEARDYIEGIYVDALAKNMVDRSPRIEEERRSPGGYLERVSRPSLSRADAARQILEKIR